MATKLTKTHENNLRERLEERFEQDKENFKANTRTLISIGVSRDRLHKMLDEVLAGEGETLEEFSARMKAIPTRRK